MAEIQSSDLQITGYECTSHITFATLVVSTSLRVTGYFPYATSTADTTAPTEPVMSLLSNTGTTVTVTWTQSVDTESGVLRYDLYQDSVKVGQSTNNIFTYTGLTANTEYLFTVKAVDYVGNESSLSDPLVVTTTVISLPSPPDISATAVSATKINIWWSRDSSFTRYRVYRNNEAIGTTDGIVYTDANLTPDTQYKYQLTGLDNTNNESSTSSPYYITTDPRGPVVKWVEETDAS